MLWQDIVLTISSLLFSPALIPMIRAKTKPPVLVIRSHRVRPADGAVSKCKLGVLDGYGYHCYYYPGLGSTDGTEA